MSEPTHVRSMHPYAFRSGEWAKILTVAPSPERDCYVVEFPDGKTDYWVTDDPLAGYEFSAQPAATSKDPKP